MRYTVTVLAMLIQHYLPCEIQTFPQVIIFYSAKATTLTAAMQSCLSTFRRPYKKISKTIPNSPPTVSHSGILFSDPSLEASFSRRKIPGRARSALYFLILTSSQRSAFLGNDNSNGVRVKRDWNTLRTNIAVECCNPIFSLGPRLLRPRPLLLLLLLLLSPHLLFFFGSSVSASLSLASLCPAANESSETRRVSRPARRDLVRKAKRGEP